MYVHVYQVNIPVYNMSIYIFPCNYCHFVFSSPLHLENPKLFSPSPPPFLHLLNVDLLGRRLADANKEKVKVTGKPEVMSPRTFQITDKDAFFRVVRHASRRVGDCLCNKIDKSTCYLHWYRYCKVVIYMSQCICLYMCVFETV